MPATDFYLIREMSRILRLVSNKKLAETESLIELMVKSRDSIASGDVEKMNECLAIYRTIEGGHIELEIIAEPKTQVIENTKPKVKRKPRKKKINS